MEWNGQFFTDDHICRMMAMFVDPVDELPDEKPFTVNDPACGSGAMFLASAWAMKRKGIDYQKKCLFIGRDIDIRCVWMAYIQMFLYQIPGIVCHGNTSRWKNGPNGSHHMLFCPCPRTKILLLLNRKRRSRHERERNFFRWLKI